MNVIKVYPFDLAVWGYFLDLKLFFKVARWKWATDKIIEHSFKRR